MPATYKVVEAVKGADKPDRGYGPMQTILLKLRNEQGVERAGITWYTKATTSLPAPESELFGDVTQSDYGWQFKKARTGPAGGSYGGRGDFKADPVKQAAIAMEASQKAAIEIERLWWGDDKGGDPDLSFDDLVVRVGQTAWSLYEQIQVAMREAAK